MEVDQNEYTHVQLVSRFNALTSEARGTVPHFGEEGSEYEIDGGESLDGTDTVSMNNELEALKRERELLQRENKLLKQKLGKDPPVGRSVDLEAEQQFPLTLLKGLVPEFDENSNFELWRSQARSVGNTYRLSENVMRMLIISKLKGKVLSWLHGLVNCANLSIDQLHNTSGTKQNRLVLRQRFEERKWMVEESFADYFNAKTMLSGALQLEEEELVDYIVDGIPDEQIRLQALMQCFKSKSQLMQAFAKVQLKHGRQAGVKQQSSAVSVDKSQTRCFNCNSLGHWVAECRKPKREFGTCFGCGDKSHKVSNCPGRKLAISSWEQNNYVSLVKFCFNYDNKECCLNLETLIDTGSPISFMKKQCLPESIEFNTLCSHVNNESYVGLNKSKLQVFGKIPCTIIINEFAVPLNLMVVADNSMSLTQF